ncbi:hypothetical protein PWJ72_10865 [Serratia nevei]|nr:hypothetical protein [Serratia nevei]
MYNVVLDTNILHEEGLNSAGMGVVNRLVNSGIINLHVPELVIKEFTTKKIDGIIESLLKASGILKSMDRDIRATETTLSHEVDGIKVSIDELSSREGANKQVISSQADSLIKISRIWADFFPANTSNQPI